MLDHVFSLIAPHPCTSCGEIGTILCDKCKYNIITTIKPLCLLCGADIASGICSKHDVFFKKAWYVGARNGVLQRIIGNYKFNSLYAGAHTLANLLHLRLPSLPSHTVIVPIPTVRSHIRVRGYDHTYRLATSLARMRRLPCSRVLIRVTDATQHTVGRSDRFKQAREAFMTRGTLDARTPYLLVDDIVTTSATLQEASRCLYQAGARIIWVAIIARQPLD